MGRQLRQVLEQTGRALESRSLSNAHSLQLHLRHHSSTERDGNALTASALQNGSCCHPCRQACEVQAQAVQTTVCMMNSRTLDPSAYSRSQVCACAPEHGSSAQMGSPSTRLKDLSNSFGQLSQTAGGPHRVPGAFRLAACSLPLLHTPALLPCATWASRQPSELVIESARVCHWHMHGRDQGHSGHIKCSVATFAQGMRLACLGVGVS